jgi:hypothetical protein
MRNEEQEQIPKRPIERPERPREGAEEIKEYELPPTEQDIDMPPVNPPKEENDE